MIYFVRHGQTENNLTHIVHDEPLNEVGLQQSFNTAQKLKDIKFDICFCSPLVRAKQTLDIIIKYHKGIKVVYDERLKERDYGKLEGCYTKDIKDYDKYRWLDGYNFDSNVETVSHIYNRVANFYDDILPQHKGKNILIVAHSGIARMSYFYFYGKPKDNNYSSFKLDNAKVLEINN